MSIEQVGVNRSPVTVIKGRRSWKRLGLRGPSSRMYTVSPNEAALKALLTKVTTERNTAQARVRELEQSFCIDEDAHLTRLDDALREAHAAKEAAEAAADDEPRHQL